MILQRFEYTEEELKLYHLCHTLGQLSSCKDKQVGAIVVAYDGRMGMGYNKVHVCNGLCDKSCDVTHAEDMALDTFCELEGFLKKSTVYINLFPCLRCQVLMEMVEVDRVVVFGARGNKPVNPYWTHIGKIELLPDLPKLLLSYNGPRNQRQVVQGELAELITAISDHDSRTDRAEVKEVLYEAILSEAVDVKLQLQALALSFERNTEKPLEMLKWNKLIAEFKDKFFPNKDL